LALAQFSGDFHLPFSNEAPRSKSPTPHSFGDGALQGISVKAKKNPHSETHGRWRMGGWALADFI